MRGHLCLPTHIMNADLHDLRSPSVTNLKSGTASALHIALISNVHAPAGHPSIITYIAIICMEGLRRAGSSMSRGRSLDVAPETLVGLSSSAGLDLDDDTQQELEQQITSVYHGVFKITTTHAAPNYTMPWSKLAQSTSIGTGFCIDRERKLFITNAHVVEHAVVVQVQKRGDTKKHFAQVPLCPN